MAPLCRLPCKTQAMVEYRPMDCHRDSGVRLVDYIEPKLDERPQVFFENKIEQDAFEFVLLALEDRRHRVAAKLVDEINAMVCRTNKSIEPAHHPPLALRSHLWTTPISARGDHEFVVRVIQVVPMLDIVAAVLR